MHPSAGEKDLVVDRLIRSKRRSVSLVIDENASLVIRAPLRMPLGEIERIVRDKEDWIRKHRARMRQHVSARPQRLYQEGESFLWLGRTLRLGLVGNARQVRREDSQLLVPAIPEAGRAVRIAYWYREEARKVLSERVRLWSAIMGLPVDRVTITFAEKRWGSCSGRARLNFAARLVMAPLEVIDYVVVHELAHVTHKNHGPRFWELVASQIPEYGIHRRWLAEHTHGMVM